MVNDGYEPEAVEVLDQALERACRRAGEQLSVNEGLKTLLASAILEGSKQGIEGEEQLASFALRSIPAFREGRQIRTRPPLSAPPSTRR